MEAPLFATAVGATAAAAAGANVAAAPHAASAFYAAPTSCVQPPRHSHSSASSAATTATNAPRHLFASATASNSAAELLGNCWTTEETWHNVYSWINNTQVRARLTGADSGRCSSCFIL